MQKKAKFMDLLLTLFLTQNDYLRISDQLHKNSPNKINVYLDSDQLQRLFDYYFTPLKNNLVSMGIEENKANNLLLGKLLIKFPEFYEYMLYHGYMETTSLIL